MTCMRNLRARWVPLIRTGVASAVDVYGDWVFFDAVRSNDLAEVQKYDIYVFIFFIVSATMSALTIFSLLTEGCCPTKKGSWCITSRVVTKFLALEILLEDIPQFVLTALVTDAKGLTTPAAVFNYTTSGFNFFFNLMDILTPIDEGETDPSEKEKGNGNTDDEPVTPPQVGLVDAVVEA